MYVQIALVSVLLLQGPSPAKPTESPAVKNSREDTKAHSAQKQEKGSLSPSAIGSSYTPSVSHPEPASQNSNKNPDNQSYRVKVLSQPEPRDTPAFLIYVGLTAIAMIVNAAVLFAILRQNKINWRQVRINARVARAARVSARAATISANAAQQTIGSLNLQLTEMEKAANAAKDSADAALLNAQALINAERAWLLVELRRYADEAFSFIIKNHGRTPAEITLVKHLETFAATLSGFKPDERYDEPAELLYKKVLAQGESWEEGGFLEYYAAKCHSC
jgi:hypothetical protein